MAATESDQFRSHRPADVSHPDPPPGHHPLHCCHLKQSAEQVRSADTKRQHGERLSVVARDDSSPGAGNAAPPDRQRCNLVALHADEHAGIGGERKQQAGSQRKQKGCVAKI